MEFVEDLDLVSPLKKTSRQTGVGSVSVSPARGLHTPGPVIHQVHDQPTEREKNVNKI